MRKEAYRRDAPVFRKERIFGKDPFKILVLGILSTRTKDEKTFEAGLKLFSKISSPQELARMKTREIEKLIYGVGFYKNKARILKLAAKQIVKEFGGKVPENLEDLLKIKGVGKKVAKVVLAQVFGKPYIAVDVHVHRISNRLGLVSTKSPEETDKILEKIIPDKLKVEFNRTLVGFGQTVCKPLKPLCDECPIKKFCPKIGV